MPHVARLVPCKANDMQLPNINRLSHTATVIHGLQWRHMETSFCGFGLWPPPASANDHCSLIHAETAGELQGTHYMMIFAVLYAAYASRLQHDAAWNRDLKSVKLVFVRLSDVLRFLQKYISIYYII